MVNVNLFETSEQSLVIRPKTVVTQAFHYSGIADLENLIGFIGSAPKVNIDKGAMVLSFGKYLVKDNSIITRTPFGEVQRVMSCNEANELYEIAAQSEFKPEHKNKVVAKPVKVRAKKAK
jgi:hypothetical protein